MATISERLAYVLTFDTSSGVKSLEKMGATADKELGKVDKRLDRLGVGMQKFGAGAVAAAGIAGVGLFKMAQGAADADANMSALEQVVGDVVAQDIGKWAEGAARSVGLASKEAVAATTQFAGLGKIIGLGGEELADFATQHVELAADMAAFKNVAPQQAIEDISAAYAGSTEVLRKYNIFLDERTLKEAYARETGEEVTGTLSTQQKIIAVNAELYRQSADMAGQFARESGELSGQQAILKAELTNLSDEIGAGVLPHLVSLFGIANSVVGVFGSMDAATNGMVGTVATAGVALLAFGGAISFVIGKLIVMRTNLAAAGISFRNLGRFAGVAKLAIGGAAIAMIGYTLHAAKSAAESQKFAEAIDDLNRAADEQIVTAFGDALAKGAIAGDGLDDSLQQIAESSPGVLQRMLDIEDASGGLTAQFMAQGLSAAEAAEWVDKIGVALENERGALDNAAASTDGATESTDGLTEATDAAALATEAHNKAQRDAADALQERMNAARAAAEAEEAMKEAVLESINSSLAYRNQVADTSAAVAAANEVMGKAKKGTAEYDQAARDAEGAAYDQAAAALRLADDQAAANGSQLTAKERTEIYRDELIKLKDTLNGDAAIAIQMHIDRLNAIPRSISTTARVQLEQVQSEYQARAVPRGATGGIVTRPTLALIGEAGPEAVVPLNKTPGSSPLPSGGMGGGVTININSVNALNPQQAAKEITQILDRYGRNGGPR